MEPGIPTANSIPVKPSSAAFLEASARDTPLPKVMPSSLTSIVFSILPSLITRPRMPLSRTSKLEPLPTKVTGMLCSLARANNLHNSSSLDGVANKSAGPPILKEV